jgi:glycosyltransferase involved in cell wall biosynthesis
MNLPEVAIVYGGPGGSTRYRCIHAQEQLSLMGVSASAVPLGERRLLDFVQQAKGVILCRLPYDREVHHIFQATRSGDGIVLFDTDDLVFDERAFPAVIRSSGRARVVRFLEQCLLRDEARRYAESMRRADGLIVSTEFLAQEVQKFSKPTRVHRNAFNIQMLRVSQEAVGQRMSAARSDKVVIGYASGTPTHDRDFREAKPALERILREHPEVHLRIIGYLERDTDWGSARNRVHYETFVHWQELPLRLAQLDINIAPLDRTSRFCQAKSEVKCIEAGLVGVPTIASRTSAFEYAIRDGETGLLADTAEDWYRCLKALVVDTAARQEMGERAMQDVLARYHPLVRAREMINALNEVSEQLRGRAFWPVGKGLESATIHVSTQDGGDLRREPPQLPCRRAPLMARAWQALWRKGMRTFLLLMMLFIARRIARALGRGAIGDQ